MLEKILDGRTLTVKYRDEINIQRHDIINNYSKDYSEQGEIYYVYNKRSDNTYGLVSHKNGETGTSISIKENQLPKDAGIDSVLRIKNGEFVLDKEVTEKLQIQLKEMINNLLEAQFKILTEQRIEGHIYEFVEKTGDTVWLIDETKDTGECFEEIDFPKELLDLVIQGTRIQYFNGKYKLKQ